MDGGRAEMGIQSLTSAFSGAVSVSLRPNTHDLDQFARVRIAGWAAGRVGGTGGSDPVSGGWGPPETPRGISACLAVRTPRGRPRPSPEALGDSKRAATRAATHARLAHEPRATRASTWRTSHGTDR